MPRDVVETAKRHAARVPGQITVYASGRDLVVLVANAAREPFVIARGAASSAGEARRAHARYFEVLEAFPHLGFGRALAHAIELAQAEWRVACRRKWGRGRP